MNKRLFEDEEQDLMRDIQSLPRNSALRKINDLSKRARLAKVSIIIFILIYLNKFYLKRVSNVHFSTFT